MIKREFRRTLVFFCWLVLLAAGALIAVGSAAMGEWGTAWVAAAFALIGLVGLVLVWACNQLDLHSSTLRNLGQALAQANQRPRINCTECGRLITADTVDRLLSAELAHTLSCAGVQQTDELAT